MKKNILFSGLVCLILGSAFFQGAKVDRADQLANPKTLILYDATSGALPDASLLGFTAFPPDAAAITYSDGATLMDTTLAGSDAYAGWVSNSGMLASFPVLDRAAGAQVNFTIQLESESHANNNRAGFSVILLDSDAKGVELSFWPDAIWAQNDDSTGGLFTYGESVAYATTAGFIDYQLTLSADTYTLTANSVPILTGPVRDYSSFEGFLDPYETPNFLFMGDDTTSAQSRVRLRFVSITGTEPVLPASTATSTSVPQPTVSLTVAASTTPTPSPTTNDRIFDICPFGWLFVLVLVGNGFIVRKSRRFTNQL